MKKFLLPLFLGLLPLVTFGAERNETRIGLNNMRAQAASRNAPSAANLNLEALPTGATRAGAAITSAANLGLTPVPGSAAGLRAGATDNKTVPAAQPASSGDCRKDYRDCMDTFCLRSEEDGRRCSCSDNYFAAESRNKAVEDKIRIADEKNVKEVARIRAGAIADSVMGPAGDSGEEITMEDMLRSLEDTAPVGTVADDKFFGDVQFNTAYSQCKTMLNSCEDKREMEELLYAQLVSSDCKEFDGYLDEKERNAELYVLGAEMNLVAARKEMFGKVNKYNRGECREAYRTCIQNAGGCGADFENCLDETALRLAGHVCEGILNQCMDTRPYVLSDWAEEQKTVLKNANLRAEELKPQMCYTRIQGCLEENCAKSTNALCLSNINIASGVCKVIDECDKLVPGMKSYVEGELGLLNHIFCRNDITSCLIEKCGTDFASQECEGQPVETIMAKCPQNLFPACKSEKNFKLITNDAMLIISDSLRERCTNRFSELLGQTFGTDMARLPMDSQVASLTAVPKTETELVALRDRVRQNAREAVDKEIEKMREGDKISDCVKNRAVGDAVFNTAVMIAQIGAENRAIRELELKIIELNRSASLVDKKRECEVTLYPKQEAPTNIAGLNIRGKSQSEINKIIAANTYTYVKTSKFEDSLSTCHVCRVQHSVELGGEKEATSGLKSMSGMASSGASTGMMAAGGWGALAGLVIGGVGGFAAGYASGGQTLFPIETESCEDIAM